LILWIAIGLTILKAILVLLRGPAPIELDSVLYWKLGEAVRSGDVFFVDSKIAFRTPIYPWLVAASQHFGSYSLLVLSVIQSTLIIASIWIAALIAEHIVATGFQPVVERSTGWKPVATLVWFLSLPLISIFTYSNVVLTESLFAFVLMLHLHSVVRFASRPSHQRAVFIGLTFGIAILTRPVVMHLWIAHAFFFSVIWVSNRIQLRKDPPLADAQPSRAREGEDTSTLPLAGESTPVAAERGHGLRLSHVLLMLIATSLFVVPWMARNNSMFGRLKVTEFLGRNLWITTFQEGSAAGCKLPDSEAMNEMRRQLPNIDKMDWRHTWTISDAVVASGLKDAQADRLMQRVAFDAIKVSPTIFLAKTAKRCVNFWRTSQSETLSQTRDLQDFKQHTWSYKFTPLEWLITVRASRFVWLNTLIWLVLVASCVWLAIHADTRAYGVWLLLVFCYFTSVTSLLEIETYRYRMILEPLAIATIATALLKLIERRKSSNLGTA
jgi:hypothetical protein